MSFDCSTSVTYIVKNLKTNNADHSASIMLSTLKQWYRYHILKFNDSAMNVVVHIFFQISVYGFFGYIPRSGIAGSQGSSIWTAVFTAALFTIAEI